LQCLSGKQVFLFGAQCRKLLHHLRLLGHFSSESLRQEADPAVLFESIHRWNVSVAHQLEVTVILGAPAHGRIAQPPEMHIQVLLKRPQQRSICTFVGDPHSNEEAGEADYDAGETCDREAKEAHMHPVC
jgi:hypothetical protein